jgi:ABC-2 type transport system ATP-binding protein
MQKIIHIKDMSYSIPYSDSILEKVNLEVSEGEFLGVLGHNGAGKTTLMDLLMGFRKISSGELQIFGEDPHAIARAHRKDVVFLSQEISLKSSISISEFLKFHSSFYDSYSKKEESHLLKIFKLDPESKIGSLSTGQQKKVQIIANLSVLPKLILIDEITAVLDPETRSIFFREIERFRKEHKCAIVLATNIAEDLVDRCDKIFFIKNKLGKVHTPSEIAGLFNLSQEVA